jgi:hypothetical protein
MLQPAIRARKMPVIKGRHIAAPQENMRIRSGPHRVAWLRYRIRRCGEQRASAICINSGAIEVDEASLASRCRAFQSERQTPTRDGSLWRISF